MPASLPHSATIWHIDLTIRPPGPRAGSSTRMVGMKATYLDPRVGQYVLAHATQPDEVLEALAKETVEATGGDSEMQISPEQGPFLTMLAQIAGARNAVEIGTFTGYSSICIARGLAPGGRLTCFDVSEQWTSIARRHWREAGVADRIDLILGPAAETLAAWTPAEPVDLAFIDADKGGYPVYYDLLMDRLAPGGVILCDNTLRRGTVADPDTTDPVTEAMRAFNDKVMTDPRVTTVLLPLADGLTLIRKN